VRYAEMITRISLVMRGREVLGARQTGRADQVFMWPGAGAFRGLGLKRGLRSADHIQPGDDRGDDRPPSVTETNELRKPGPKNCRQIQASAGSSNAIAPGREQQRLSAAGRYPALGPVRYKVIFPGSRIRGDSCKTTRSNRTKLASVAPWGAGGAGLA